MSGFGFVAEFYFFHFDKITHVSLFADDGFGTQAGIWPHACLIFNDNTFDVTTGLQMHTVADNRIRNKTVGLNNRKCTDGGFAADESVRINNRARTNENCFFNVGCCRIYKNHTGFHQFVNFILENFFGGLSQFGLIIHPVRNIRVA